MIYTLALQKPSPSLTGREGVGLLNKLLTSHFSRYGQAHDLQYRRSYVGEDTIGGLYILVLSNIYEGHGVE